MMTALDPARRPYGRTDPAWSTGPTPGPTDILVGVDGSPASVAAARWAAREAPACHLDVFLVHATRHDATGPPVRSAVLGPPGHDTPARVLERTRAALHVPGATRVRMRVVALRPGPVLSRWSARVPLVVVGQHVEIAPPHRPDVSELVLARSTAETVVVPTHWAAAAEGCTRPVVLLADDLAALRTSLPRAFAAAEQRHAGLRVVLRDRRRSTRPGAAYALAVATAGVPPTYPDVAFATAAVRSDDALLAAAAEAEPQLVIVARPRSSPFTDHWLLSWQRSLAGRATRTPVAPVLVIDRTTRTPAPDGEAELAG